MTLPSHEPIEVSDQELSEFMLAAGQAADAAAAVTMQYFRQRMDVVNKSGAGGFDPVTVADRLAESVIREALQKLHPQIGFYGEEHEPVNGTNGLLWVVDPIDGTRAFVSGMPLWGTLIGLYNGRDSVLGLLDQPFFKERYQGSRLGSSLVTPDANQVLHTRRITELSEAIMYCTTPDMFDSADSLRCFEHVRNAVQLTRYGGDCYAYALLAAGYVDIVLDCDLKPYDIQALIPIVENAGGIVTNWQGDSAVQGGYVVACGSPDLYEKVLPLLKIDSVD